MRQRYVLQVVPQALSVLRALLVCLFFASTDSCDITEQEHGRVWTAYKWKREDAEINPVAWTLLVIESPDLLHLVRQDEWCGNRHLPPRIALHLHIPSTLPVVSRRYSAPSPPNLRALAPKSCDAPSMITDA